MLPKNTFHKVEKLLTNYGFLSDCRIIQVLHFFWERHFAVGAVLDGDLRKFRIQIFVGDFVFQQRSNISSNILQKVMYLPKLPPFTFCRILLVTGTS